MNAASILSTVAMIGRRSRLLGRAVVFVTPKLAVTQGRVMQVVPGFVLATVAAHRSDSY